MVKHCGGTGPARSTLGRKHGRFGTGFCLFLLAILASVFHPSPSHAQAISKEYQVKAAFLFNFVQFVQWPADTFTNTAEPFRIGILGDDPFGSALDQVVEGESIHEHKLVVVRLRRLHDLENCRMIFISKSEHGHMGEILAKLKGRGILTVSEVPGFCSHGGIINFFLEGNKVRFEINPAAAQREGLKISSQLLNLGKIVEAEASARKEGA